MPWAKGAVFLFGQVLGQMGRSEKEEEEEEELMRQLASVK
jgi:hypothetical protein